MATVAWLYHTRGLRQNAIADRLNISQSKVSRLLEQAVDLDIVQTVVVLPTDEQSVLESELESTYGLQQACVYDIGSAADESQLVRELGQLLALQLQTMPLEAAVIGFTSWSRTMQETLEHLRPLKNSSTRYVVEMVGDLGPPALQHLAAQYTQQLAEVTGAEPLFLRVPGVMPSIEVKRTLLAHDSHARSALRKLDEIDFALIGIGSGDIVPPLRAGDNFFTAEQVAQAKDLGAVGEVNLHYIAENGDLVDTDFSDLVVGVSVATTATDTPAPRRRRWAVEIPGDPRRVARGLDQYIGHRLAHCPMVARPSRCAAPKRRRLTHLGCAAPAAGANQCVVSDGFAGAGSSGSRPRRKGSAVVRTSQVPGARRMIATVAWLYHTRGLRQGAIAERLNISQSRVSRMLDQAVDLGIVRTMVVLPQDEQSVLEEELESAYGLKEAHVFDVGQVHAETDLVRELGQLLGLYLQRTTLGAGVVGFTSWSRALHETVRTLQPLPLSETKFVVEMLGDLGPPALQHQAAHNTQLLASVTGAEPMFLRVPGVMPSAELRETLLGHDSHARATMAKLDGLDLALTGIGAVGVVAPLQAGDNFFTAAQIDRVHRRGAVGEINLRYLAEDGEPVQSDLDELVVGASLDQLKRAERRLVVAGGVSKHRAIRAALVGGWINVVFTDSVTARWLVDHRG